MTRPRSRLAARSRNPWGHSTSRQARPAIESLEDRIVLDGGLADLAMMSATTPDSRSVTFGYGVTLPGSDLEVTAEVAFFRSSDRVYDPADDVRIETQVLTLALGEHTLGVPLPEALAIDPSRPYVLAVADPFSEIDEADEGNNTASFRILTIGAVSHGFELFPGDSAWVDDMARSLEDVGYDVGIAFHWDAISALPIPGMTSLAGWQLTGQVVDAVSSLGPQTSPGDVIALHLIGHSRGSVVISQAALDLEWLEELLPGLAPLKAGPLKLTFLDPHPANNAYSGTLYSAAPNQLGQIGTSLYNWFQSGMLDPNVVVPASADWAEVYYQRTSYMRAVTPTEQLFLLWGQDEQDIEVRAPETTVLTSRDLTDTAENPGVPSHFLVHDWYQETIVPTLGGSSSVEQAGGVASTASVMATGRTSAVLPQGAFDRDFLGIFDLGMTHVKRDEIRFKGRDRVSPVLW
ncbi:MAG: hypothetical protein U0790_08410 [Isosphaeraceae bacterium]